MLSRALLSTALSLVMSIQAFSIPLQIEIPEIESPRRQPAKVLERKAAGTFLHREVNVEHYVLLLERRTGSG